MSAHLALWSSIDFVAKLKKCSCSRLAINGNLDPTAFNKSKRRSKHGQEHWISFGSLIRALNGTNVSLIEFAIIYQILYTYKTIPDPDHVQKIMSDVNKLIKQRVENAPQKA